MNRRHFELVAAGTLAAAIAGFGGPAAADEPITMVRST